MQEQIKELLKDLQGQKAMLEIEIEHLNTFIEYVVLDETEKDLALDQIQPMRLYLYTLTERIKHYENRRTN